MESTAKIIVCLPVALMMVASPVRAEVIQVLYDPIGDLNDIMFDPPDYQDIVTAELENVDGVYEFSMTMVASIPDKPAVSKCVKMTFWTWGIDSDPTTSPLGAWPLPPGYLTNVEFHIVVIWDGQEFRAILADHRPLLIGEPEIVYSIDYSKLESKLSVTIQEWMLGDIEGSIWGASTSVWTKNMEPENNTDWSASYFMVDWTDWSLPLP